ncbi:hypothetical protein ACFO1B_42675 [Dactylosporangium siamense]|uniref:hypothetical protein n=1 Tax=Dactylosporangium siamense TaxID=685454 RepID=UPI0019444CB4|nr:hypothetical protein [Dactylosporangium siamense]
MEFQVDNGTLTIGASAMPDDDGPTPAELPEVTPTQIFVQWRQQVGPVRVELWRTYGPPTAHEVASAVLQLAAGRMVVGETFRPPCLSWQACAPGGSLAVRVGADSEQDASVVTVVLDPVDERLPSTRERAGLARRLADYQELANLDVVLVEHSFPVERCAAAVRTIRRAVDQGVHAARVRYGVESLVEWMRWLRADVSTQDIDGLVEEVMLQIAADAPLDETARVIIAGFAERLGMTLDGLLVARR